MSRGTGVARRSRDAVQNSTVQNSTVQNSTVQNSTVQNSAARVVAAALVCIARHGVAKTTVDDVAREAGCARASVYRLFGSRAGLLRSTLLAEAERVAEEVELAVLGSADLEDAVVAFLETADEQLRDHTALQFVLNQEPELLLPHLVFERGRVLLVTIANRFAPAFARFLPESDAARAAEWCARILLAHPCGPTSRVDLADPSTVRPFVRSFVLPAFSRYQGV